MSMTIRGVAAAASLATALAACPAAAAVVEADASTGIFKNPVTDDGSASAPGSSSIRWGEVAGGPFDSAYAYRGYSASADSGSFTLGRFKHRNGNIWEDSPDLESVNLKMRFSGTLAGTEFSFSRKVSVTHDETLNRGRPCGQGGDRPCGDALIFSEFEAFEFEATADGTTYTMVVDGLVNAEGEEVDGLFTREKRKNFVYVVGRVSTTTQGEPGEPTEPTPPVGPQPPSPIPLPASGALILGALGALGIARRRS